MRIIIFSFLRVWVAIMLIAGLTGISKTHAAPPSDFSLILPEDGASVSTSVLLDWEDSTTSNELMYRIYVSKDNDAFEDPIRLEGIEESSYILEEKDGIEDASTYFWKVCAIDENLGEYTESEVRQFHTDNNTNPVPAWIGGHIFSSEDTPVVNAVLTISIWDKLFKFYTDLIGSFLGELSPEDQINPGTEISVTIQISAEGYVPISRDMTIKTGEKTVMDFTIKRIAGNIDGKGDVDLKDAVMAFQILTGKPISYEVYKEAALEEDGKIGLSELHYILTQIAVTETNP